MSLEEFHKWLKEQPIEDKLVYMRYRYSCKDEWEYSNEYLEVDMCVDGYYIWHNDWHEGQKFVEILGCISINKIEIPMFESKMQEGEG